MGVDLVVMGDKEPAEGDEVVHYAEPSRGVYKKMVVRDGRLAGAILLGDPDGAPTIQQAFDRAIALPENRAELLFPSMRLDTPASAAALPDDAQICNCNGVTKGRLTQAIAGGCRSLRSLCDATRAGTGCGSCKPQVQQVLEACAGDVRRRGSRRALLRAWRAAAGSPSSSPRFGGSNLRSVSAVFAALADSWRGSEEQGRTGLAAEDHLGRRLRGRARRPLHQRPRPRQHPARRHVQRHPAHLRRRHVGGAAATIADVADKHQVPMVKITGGQRIDLLGIPKDKLPDVWRDLGMPSGHAYAKAFRTCKTCVGTEFCRYGVGDSTALGIAIEQRFQGLESPHKMKLATAGCPRNCSEATTKDLGAVAIEGGRWEIYIGGGAGSKVRKGDVLCTVSTHEDVLVIDGALHAVLPRARALSRDERTTSSSVSASPT